MWSKSPRPGLTRDETFVPGTDRAMFELRGIRFGIAICIEGCRYPETVRWAAVRGAHVVFHPNLAGSDQAEATLRKWGALDSPYYEKVMVCRSAENSIYFASVNYALKYPAAATAVIAPDGTCIDLQQADRLYADRLAPETY
jgi:predicted amidohydrolase